MSAARTTSERVAVVEEKIDRLEAQATRSAEALSAKMDEILRGQQAGAEDRASMRRDIAEMKPHVQTIAQAKTFWSWSLQVGGVLVAVGVGGWQFFAWLRQYFTLRGH